MSRLFARLNGNTFVEISIEPMQFGSNLVPTQWIGTARVDNNKPVVRISNTMQECKLDLLRGLQEEEVKDKERVTEYIPLPSIKYAQKV